MTRSTNVTLTCSCGTEFETTIYQAVNITLQPELLYRLLYGSLNVAVCPNCGRKAESAQPFVYHDMKRGLFAYVSPTAEVPMEEREALLDRLRRVYTQAVAEAERRTPPRAPAREQPRPTVRRRTPAEELHDRIEPDAPPMQVIFGVDRLVTLVDSLLEPEEKLGKVALSTHHAGPVERDRLLRVASQMAQQMGCLTEVEDEPDNFTVWLYGPRARVARITRALNTAS